MTKKINIWSAISYFLGAVVFIIGVLNLIFVHPVPGVVFLLLSAFHFPPINALIKAKLGFSIPPVVTIISDMIIIWFTLGVSDLGDMIDKL